MSKRERLALTRLIAARMTELGIPQRAFMKVMGFNEQVTAVRYIVGGFDLQIWQVPPVARLLQLDEGEILLMCLAQFFPYDMEVFNRHIRPDQRESLS
ncbi:hypothetical protein [Rhizobium leguminosarum]|uniref:hypothetical protein n=1 Tax=Rhizobium TaxID=379 RepID=UPI00140FC33C|nr:hypothetical protein [Rhizobium leguminosarum]QIO66050.1 hypothetical protein HA462_13750 [Rhizobium leguminosarum bv. trifolii]